MDIKEEFRRMLIEKGFSLMDSDHSEGMEKEVWRKEKLDVLIEFIVHKDNL